MTLSLKPETKELIMFFTSILSIGFIFSALFCIRLFGLQPISNGWKALGFIFCLFCFTAPVWTFHRSTGLSGTWYTIYSDTLYFLFVFASLSLCLMIIRDFAWLFIYKIATWQGIAKHSWHFMNPAAVARANAYLLSFMFAICLYALYEGKKVPDVRRIEIASAKIKQPLTIAVLGDLHLDRSLSLNKLRGIVERSNALNPDIIVLPGDTIDDTRFMIAKHVEILKGFHAKYGTFATSGNHEFYVGLDASRKMIENAGINYLSNEGINVDGIHLAAIEDWKTVQRRGGKTDVGTAVKNNGGKYTILLSHTPLPASSVKPGWFDLEISGHTHGGQIFPFHFFSWYSNNHFLQGLYEKENYKAYVTRGSGQWGPPLRLFAPSEITLITLKPKE